MIATGEEKTINVVEAMISRYVAENAELWDCNYVDPREAYYGPDGEVWRAIGTGATWGLNDEPPYRTEQELMQMRAVGRLLSRENEFAQNGHENRISYIIGDGHTYVVTGKEDDTPRQAINRVQSFVDNWLEVNAWPTRQQETILRADRDGELFLRFFRVDDGYLRVRFIEPGNVTQPTNTNTYESFGIRNAPGDVETVTHYHVAGEGWVDAECVQHRKYNVDSGLKRGIPLFWSVRRNLARATKLLRNMSLATEIQTAIALIRKHEQATQTAVRAFITNRQNGSVTDANGTTKSVLKYPGGSIVDVPANMSYEIPPQLDPSKTVAALQAELRAVASRLVFPEFMLTSDASNAAFASTMVAEGPAVKKFQRDQSTQVSADSQVIKKALAFAVEKGLLTQEEVNATKVTATPPTVTTRDTLKEAQTRQIDMLAGILSPQTATAEAGRDYKTEQDNIEQHQDRGGAPLAKAQPLGVVA